MRAHRDLRAAVYSAALCAVLALLAPLDPLRAIFALPLTLFLPGYAISAAIFARNRIERRQFLLFSAGLSLAVLALGGLVLNYLPGGIRSGWWALLLFLVVLGACRSAALRRPRRAPAPVAWTPPRLNRAQAALLGGGAAAIVAAVVLAFVPLSATNAIGYTEMWIQPLEGSAATGVRIGVGSGERDDSSYRLLVRFGNDATLSRRFKLRPGENRVLELRDEATGVLPGATIPASAILYKEDSPNPDQPFRRVSTWIAAPGGPG